MKVRTEARREAIIEAAAHLFQEVGYERASMNELTRRLGGSKATLYGYFPSKEALFVEVVRSVATVHLSEAVGLLSAHGEEELTFEQKLTCFGERMLFVLTNESSALAVYRMVMAEAGRSNIGMLFYEAGPSDCIEVLSTWMGEAMSRGELGQAAPQVRAAQFLALLTAEVQVRLYQPASEPLEVEQIRALVLRAVGMFMGGAASH
ncbi:TetR/AcrR family transcriptional regulator [Pseudomonas gingeri]|uniref:TetR/AcrR family transcriptional regulator n=1 Tax=Pseudomonas gingeri TaxID=117681 RepID=A0A7Y8C337_9PSED|nr:TetR/AcrR family transcriptional regulator [Pseudomonas gingeri]NWA24396.1 TetR/AcrR family transcriptional regulator [Pseudomonas gingeri]NWB96992.1 TetR/AcrR family transcriptional regulator [Pseudomonas gingeri]NWD67010.1 TetR/AcrR family transcriptional regulator [Pseudomonas gingeri]NWD73685.1 TetR/AcrR family transcriptional regulator [Pseudomonas gingeri]